MEGGYPIDTWIAIAQRADKDWETIAKLLGSSHELNDITRAFTRVIVEGGEHPLVPDQLLQFTHLEEIKHPVELLNRNDYRTMDKVIRENKLLRSVALQFDPKVNHWNATAAFQNIYKSHRNIVYTLFLWDDVEAIVREHSLCLFGSASAVNFQIFIVGVNGVNPIKRLFIAFNLRTINTIKGLGSLRELTLDFTNSPGFSHYNPVTDKYTFQGGDIIELLEEVKGIHRLGFYTGGGYEVDRRWNYGVTDEFILAFQGNSFPNIRELDFPILPRYLGAIKEIFPNLQKPLLQEPVTGQDIGEYLYTLKSFDSLYKGFRLIPGREYPPIPRGERVATTMYTNIIC